MQRIFLVLIFTFILCLSSFAQAKFERELRVKSREVPVQARLWVREAFDQTRRLKWFFEETSGKKSYEAKFRSNGSDFSVEFDTTGAIEDVEIEKEWSQLPDETRNALHDCFSGIDKFNLKRIQQQWTGPSETLKSALRTRSKENITIRYEIEFTAVLDGEYAMWEGTFAPDGALLNYRKVILRPAENLNY